MEGSAGEQDIGVCASGLATELATLPASTASGKGFFWVAVWKELKKWRRLPLGPLALVFKMERSVAVSRNSRSRLDDASVRHKEFDSAAPVEPRLGASAPASRTGSVRELALIVGVGPGLGVALAKRLAKEGMAVVMASRNAERLDRLADEIRGAGGVAVAYGCDATSEISVCELFRHVCARHGVPNLVVYALQGSGPGKAVDIEVPAFEDCWKHNCLGAFLVARQAARSMIPLARGTILLTGSTSSLLGRAGHLNLAVGKFGQRALAQVLARELCPQGIHVAHLIIDADINEGNGNHDGQPRSEPEHICESVLSLHRQPRTAWTSEADVRPWNETFWEHC
jgi:NAD(P)-dependent dehydrogenase (short-subunit alcohol dehydrogenase family)